MVDFQNNQAPVNQGEIETLPKTTQGGESNPSQSQHEHEKFQPAPAAVGSSDVSETKEYSPEEYKELYKLYEDTLSDYIEGELVVGKILAIGDKEVTIDIGFKSEGTVPLEEFAHPEDLKVGDDVEVYIENIEDVEGRLLLSRKKVDFIHSWERVLKSYEKGDILQGKCVRRIKGGIVVDLDGVDAFLPGSQIDVKPIRDFDAFIGQTLDFKVVKVNSLRKNIVVSHRVLVEEEMKGQRQKILDNLTKGQILEGTVKNITDFGVFIDLGGVDGLLHINDLSWGRVSHPSEIVSYDQTIKVMVLDFNEEKDRISLGYKQLQPHPWEKVTEKYPVGKIVQGKVVNISDYGAFVELEKGVEGLIHISEMSWTQHIKHPSKILSVGEIIEAKILSINEQEKKISLGLKQLEPDPWDTLEQKYPVGSRHEGKVRNLTNFGAFVELEEGIDGLIHISDLSWTKKIRHPGEVLKKGDTIEVVVLNVDRENRRISLGYKQIKDSPWEEFGGKYRPGTITKGKIVRLIEKGVIAELPDEVDGFVPMSHLAKPNLTKPADGYKVGDELELCVIEFNKEAKKIVLSEKIDHAMGIIRQKAQGAPVEIEVAEDLFGDIPEAEKIPAPAEPKVEATVEAAVTPTEAQPETSTASSQPIDEAAAPAKPAAKGKKRRPKEAADAEPEAKAEDQPAAAVEKSDDNASAEPEAKKATKPRKSRSKQDQKPETADESYGN
ncbi:MAG: 30S ribosomal protein S1 [candidate division KSB1 bacterium]|nr:30S ribosomal protein S1 [candidate division KSB1 bacterium]